MGKIHISDSTIEEIAALSEYDETKAEEALDRLLRARQRSNMNNGTIEADFEQVKQVQAVNMDEVNREVIEVKVFRYKEVPLFDDDNQPFCDEQGKQYIGREVVGTRTAKIKNIVPLDAYHEAIGVMNGFEGSMPSKDQLDHMTELILKCWQISEPFMTKKTLRESMDGERLMGLFTRFFNQENPQ